MLWVFNFANIHFYNDGCLGVNAIMIILWRKSEGAGSCNILCKILNNCPNSICIFLSSYYTKLCFKAHHMPRMRLPRKKTLNSLAPLFSSIYKKVSMIFHASWSTSRVEPALYDNLCLYPQGCPFLNLLVPHKFCECCLWMPV